VVVIDAQMHEPPMAFEWADADPRGGSNSWRRSPSPTCARAGWTARVSHPTVGLEGECATARMPDRFTFAAGPLVAAKDGTMTTAERRARRPSPRSTTGTSASGEIRRTMTRSS